MRRRARRVAGIWAGICWAVVAGSTGAALAQPAGAPQLNVVISQGPATVGDRIEALLTLRVPAAELAGEPRFPDWAQGWGDAEVIEQGPVTRKVDAGTAVYRQRLLLAAWQPGTLPLPKLVIPVPLKARTVNAEGPDNLVLSIGSVLPPPKEGEPPPAARPPAPTRPLPVGAAFLWTAAALAAACLAAAWQLYRRHQDQRESAVAGTAPLLAPWEELEAALGRLPAEVSPAAAVALHTGLSLALRRYLGRRLDFPATESTTSEIRRRLLDRRLPSALVQRGGELLSACDLVKFARQEVGETLGRERVETARALGRDLESYLRPPALPAPPATAPAAPPPRLERAG